MSSPAPCRLCVSQVLPRPHVDDDISRLSPNVLCRIQKRLRLLVDKFEQPLKMPLLSLYLLTCSLHDVGLTLKELSVFFDASVHAVQELAIFSLLGS